MENNILIAWWRAACEPMQLLANWQDDFAATWVEVYVPSGAARL